MVRLMQTRNTSQPFFLYAAFQNTHTPIAAPQEYVDKCTARGSIRAEFCGDVLALDGGVGVLFSELRSLNMYNNSIIIFSTDNGGNLHGGK